MNDIIRIRNLSFSYNDNVIFDNFNLSIAKGSFTTIIGNNGSGKSTLVKILLGLKNANGDITINGFSLDESNIRKVRRLIGVVFENPDSEFVTETVVDDLAFTLENLQFSKEEILEKIEYIAKKLEIEHLLTKNPRNLSGGEKQLVALATALISNPPILLLDEPFTMVDGKDRERIFNIVREYNKTKYTTVINITHDIEDTLYGDYIIVMNQGKIDAIGETKEILKKDELFKENNIDLPFIVKLSKKLCECGVVDEIYFRNEDLIDNLWK